MNLLHSHYTQNIFGRAEDLARTIDRAVETLLPYSREFESIAFRGMSGAVAAAPLALRLGKHLTCVRKSDGSHADRPVEGAHSCRYIIIDDLVATANTVRTIQETINRATSPLDRPSECVGIYLYNEGTYYPRSKYGHLYWFVNNPITPPRWNHRTLWNRTNLFQWRTHNSINYPILNYAN